MKTCNKCNIPKPEEKFYFRNSQKAARRATCILCAKKYHEENMNLISIKRKEYRENNKDILRERNKSDKRREQNRLSKQRTRKQTNIRDNNKRRNNPSYRIRRYLSSKIARALKKMGSGKEMSFLKFVPYTMDDFKSHLESQFEPWMSWDNHGPYKVSDWDDNDQSTWTWSIDHIIPQSDLPYTSMYDDNFKKCWSLDNLRPLSAKQNLLDGVNKIRHKA